MLGWSLNLGFAGGQAAGAYVANTLIVEEENTTLIVKDTNEVMTIYKDPDAKKVMAADFTDWLGDGNISTATWTTSSNNITMSDSTATSKKATSYVSGGTLGDCYEVYCKIVTDESVARTEIRTFRVRIVRMA